MWLIVVLYLLMASTFTLAKLSVAYMQPIFFIGLRMILGGSILLGYIYYCKRLHWKFAKKDFWLFLQVIIFHIYCVYVFEFWAMQFLTSSKACLLYNLAPFATVLICYFLFNQKLSAQKWYALLLGFIGMIPLSWADSSAELALPQYGFISLAEISLLVSVFSGAYGWILLKQLMDRGYSPGMINGFGMFWGGIAALITALIVEGWHPFIFNAPHDLIGNWLIAQYGIKVTTYCMSFGCLIALIGVANIAGYNLYGYLLRRYSATFLSFAGFITPFFAGIFGWVFICEKPTLPFFISLIITTVSLFWFYREEMRLIKKI